MFLFYLINLIHGESDFITSIRNQLSMNQNDVAFQAANSKILESSNDVDNTLFFLRGCASVKMHNFDQGISDLSLFLSDINNVSPKDKTEAYSLRATAYLQTGQLDESQKDAQQINDKTIIQNIKKARTWLTYANSKKDNSTFTVQCYVKLIEICPFSQKFIENLTILALKKENKLYSTNIMTKGKSTLPEETRIMIKLLYSFLTVDRSYISELSTSTKSIICQHLQQQIKDYRSTLIKALDCLNSKDFICTINYIDHCYQILTELPSKNTTHFLVLTEIKENITNFSKNKINKNYKIVIELLEEIIDPNPYSEILNRFKNVSELEIFESDLKIYNNVLINVMIQKDKLNELYKKLINIKKKKDSYSEEKYNKMVTAIENDIQKGEKKMELFSNKDFDPLYSMFGLNKKADLSDVKKAYMNISNNNNLNYKEKVQINIAYEFLNVCKKEWDKEGANEFKGESEINLTKTQLLTTTLIEIVAGKKIDTYCIEHGRFSDKCTELYLTNRYL